jgi:hypothetical protein
MTISHNRALKSSAPDGSHRAPGAPARSPDAVEALVGSSDIPLAAVGLPSGRFLAVNPPLASAVGSTVSALTGRRVARRRADPAAPAAARPYRRTAARQAHQP